MASSTLSSASSAAAAAAPPRAACLETVLGTDLYKRVSTCRLLMVGAGGIGCELLKNLALGGFTRMEIIDLDTIEVTNLNRQFLFQKQHVGKSKALVAKESALRINPALDIVAHHANIFAPDYDLSYFEGFDIVLNALDNLKARNHVNRMCLAADVPLVESGSSGYLGQVSVIRKGVSECYECTPKPKPKKFPACTVRNTPSSMVHCIAWAKFLFTHLYGVVDAENDVAPTSKEQAEGAAAAGGEETKEETKEEEGEGGGGEPKGPARKSTRQWAEENGFNPDLLFHKLFHDDVHTLLSMAKLWRARRAPTPLKADNLPDEPELDAAARAAEAQKLPEQRVWSLAHSAKVFCASVAALTERARVQGSELDWDKDDEEAMDFVCAAANLRAYAFHIGMKSRFDVKSMAGNIIPAIATTNAVVAGLIVLEAYKVLKGRLSQECRSVYVARQAMSGGRVLNSGTLVKPNPRCMACGVRPSISLRCDIATLTIEKLAEQVLKKDLSMAAPEVVSDAAVAIISAPEDEEDREILVSKVYPRTLASFGVTDGAQFAVSDDLQKTTLRMTIRQLKKGEAAAAAVATGGGDGGTEGDTPEYLVSADIPKEEEEDEAGASLNKGANGGTQKEESTADAGEAEATTGVRNVEEEEEEDDLVLVLDEEEKVEPGATTAIMTTTRAEPMVVVGEQQKAEQKAVAGDKRVAEEDLAPSSKRSK